MINYYFTEDDYASMTTDAPSEGWQNVTTKLIQLHERLIASQRRHHQKLFPGRDVPHIQSASDVINHGSLNLQYLRLNAQALIVERLMGREEITDGRETQARRHPMIEIRITSEGVAVELLLSPDAWWDQQNMVGKLTFGQHRTTFYQLLQKLDKGMCLGFWRGLYHSDMHLTTAQFQQRIIVDEFLSTFAPTKDWFRLGCWYAKDDEALQQDKIYDSLSAIVTRLYPIYEFILWTSDNNYREFYLTSVSSS